MVIRYIALSSLAALCMACVSESTAGEEGPSTEGETVERLSEPLGATSLPWQIGAAFGGSGVIREIERGQGWVRIQLEVRDEARPLVLDIVASTRARPSRVLYMLPGGGLNFEGNFFTPRDRNISHFMRENGYLVIGVSPREDGLDPADNDASVASWGLAKRKRDIRGVIARIDRWLGLPYDLLGHSAGGGQALDYAAAYDDRLGTVMVLDTTGPYDPAAEPAYVAGAKASLGAYRALLEQGRFTLDSANGLKALIAAAAAEPLSDSGISRAIAGGSSGSFTRAGFVHFALMHTNRLPGPTTPLTQRPESWFYEQGHCAGRYTFSEDPAQDRFELTHTPLAVFGDALAELGSGLVTTAMMRDLLAVWADDPTYAIRWGDIEEKVVWINTELGRGNHPRGAELIREGGNPRVKFSVVPGYGHADPVFGQSAEDDVWRLLLE